MSALWGALVALAAIISAFLSGLRFGRHEAPEALPPPEALRLPEAIQQAQEAIDATSTKPGSERLVNFLASKGIGRPKAKP